MSGSTSTNNDSMLAGFLLSAGIVAPSATQNAPATQGFLQQIGFCSSEALTIALALKQQGLSCLGGSTSTASSSGAPIMVPNGWLGNVGSAKALAGLTTTVSLLAPSLMATALVP